MKKLSEYRATDYETYRPGYPEALYDFLIPACHLEPDHTIVDVGAGTGKGSACLAARGFHVIALDAGESMLRAGPEDERVARVCGRADRLPLAASVGDLVLCAQSFHQFETEETLEELRRVLKPTGHLALFWNNAREDSKAYQAYARLITKYNPEYRCGYRDKDWNSVLERDGFFRSIVSKNFHHQRPMSIKDWQGLTRSSSGLGALDEITLAEVQKELRKVLEPLESVDIDYTTQLWLAAPVSRI